jgi:peroxiredoxin
MSVTDEMSAAAERQWLNNWTEGPTELEGSGLPAGAVAPDLVLSDQTGVLRSLSHYWSAQPVLLMFWRHFGCSCGTDRAERIKQEYDEYHAVGLQPVILAQGEPARAAAYHREHRLPCPILCDPERMAYRAYGVGQWAVERVLYDAPAEYWAHPRDLGEAFQDLRREAGRPPVDDPWRATAEFVIGAGGVVRLCYRYQFCEDFPDARVLTTAARLS